MKKFTTALVTALVLSAAPFAMADDNVPLDQIQTLQENGTIQSLQKLNAIALEQHPGATIHDSELEHERGQYIYQLELRDQQGVEWDLELDAATGAILKNRQDD
ncbi:PepSY domain-containing protein [Cellvibrio polysaccharolyticus]|uniref:Peptidase n=1 Tax=Cellvibrio polysaccharolyticus TaxID=2082724 RepID=A0A928V0P9_9GAMM|nr:PepSY domain-containing protein [Cellvibrio polysaccharolyticus]MBE8716167.1 peptidase [Cellvibrio polysaccharolyticus]